MAVTSHERSVGTMADEGEYWYCIKHKAVETRDGCPNRDRLGPYATRAEAERAIETAHEKSEAWDNDPQWNDDVLED
jgi:GMP synthase PP-ATPase subunit